jgi:fructose-1,6-bisphosphatase-3
VHRAFRDGYDVSQQDQDWFWYLWTGPVSPLFGKDRMATFETYFVEDKTTHKEHKNPYFQLIHEGDFCDRVLAEFDMKDGIIVNGHVPVKVEKGEEPVKRSGKAVTIDGAFSEAYGDRGYTLILAPEAVRLAEHHHFESIDDAITSGADIVPQVMTVRQYPRPRRLSDTEQGAQIRQQIAALQRLIRAYEEGAL